MESEVEIPPEASPDPRARFVAGALERLEGPLVRYALGLTGDLETARDVVQDAFLRLWEQPAGTVDGHVARWLFTVCRNRALDVQRKANRMSPLTQTEWDARPAPDPSPADAASTRDTLNQVAGLLADLPFNQREVVRLKFQNQLSYQEIADITALSVGNVGFLLHTALRTLRKRLQHLERESSATPCPATPDA
ncbi:MAG: sigma-70 family RNA polymerase sigma factor [Verrucomicrobiae bacterium]|nr:sigma-70 family RNA polymerase sigma factor [Verrucomicrobiae bacterium]